MGRRTSASLVRKICTISSSIDLEGFIDTASEMTDRVQAAGETSNQRLELIERWLTAHLVKVTVDPAITKKQIDITELQWNIPAATSTLSSTPYGRQALALDRTWTLEKEYGTKVESIWIGDNDPDGTNST